MLIADATQVLQCWLFISQVLLCKSRLYHVECADLDALEYHSNLTYIYLTLIESGCPLQSDTICLINDYVTLVKERSELYKEYINNSCTDFTSQLCDISYLPIQVGQPALCLQGPFLIQLS